MKVVEIGLIQNSEEPHLQYSRNLTLHSIPAFSEISMSLVKQGTSTTTIASTLEISVHILQPTNFPILSQSPLDQIRFVDSEGHRCHPMVVAHLDESVGDQVILSQVQLVCSCGRCNSNVLQ